jgi:hypothetical protein
MAGCASRTKMITFGAMAFVVLFGAASCNNGPKFAKLPTIAKVAPPPEDDDRYSGVKFRSRGGEALSPEVVTDQGPAAAPTAAAKPQEGAATLNGHPNGITRDTVNRSIQGSMGALANCFTNVTQDPMVAVSFEADPSGHPSLVRVNGAPPDAERCIRGVMQGMRFPAFEGKGVPIDFPLSFHRVGQPGQPANQAGAQQGENNAPPLFLEP